MSEKNYVEIALGILNTNINETEIVTSYWLEGSSSVDVDQSLNYCKPCADRKVVELGSERLGGAYVYARGNFDGNDSDTPCSCEECGKSLKQLLTEHGVGLELSHFSGGEFDLESAEECYALRSVLERHGEYEGLDDQIQILAFDIMSSAFDDSQNL